MGKSILIVILSLATFLSNQSSEYLFPTKTEKNIVIKDSLTTQFTSTIKTPTNGRSNSKKEIL